MRSREPIGPTAICQSCGKKYAGWSLVSKIKCDCGGKLIITPPYDTIIGYSRSGKKIIGDTPLDEPIEKVKRLSYRKVVWVLAILFLMFEIADSLITWWAVNHGFPELNPIIAPVADTWWLAAVKIVASALVAGLVIWINERFSKVWKPTPIVFIISFIPLVGFTGWVVVSNIIHIWF